MAPQKLFLTYDDLEQLQNFSHCVKVPDLKLYAVVVARAKRK